MPGIYCLNVMLRSRAAKSNSKSTSDKNRNTREHLQGEFGAPYVTGLWLLSNHHYV